MSARVLAGMVALTVAVLSGGCRAPYLARLAYEEMRFLGSATAATQLLATAQDPARRRALEALLAVREFAARQGLNVKGSYREVADTGSVSPFHVVTAAHQDRLEPYTWWYPVIGAIPYRGYFDRESADRFAARLDGEGLDTMVVQASAYSTLGWLDDPLPSSVLERGEGAVVVTVLHELVHQTFFAPGEVAFNETLATAVAWRLAERYYASSGETASAAKMNAARESWVRRSDVLDAAAARLRAFFASARARGLPRQRMLEERTAVYADILSEIESADATFAAGFAKDGLDNASFLATYRYATGGRAIDAFLAAMPSLEDAFARLDAAIARGENLRTVVAAAAN
ncbi:MAG: aminopeptidase [Candidatus Binatia bacterium]